MYLFTLFEAGPNNVGGGGFVQTENINVSVRLLIYLFHAFTSFRAQFTGSAGWTSKPFGKGFFINCKKSQR